MPAHCIPLLPFGALPILYFIRGSTYLATRFGVESWPPMLMAGMCLVIAGGLIFAWLRWRSAPLPTWREWRGAGIVGILLLSCGNGGVTVVGHWGVSSGVVALAMVMVLLSTLLFSQLFGQRNTILEWGGIMLGLFGIVPFDPGSDLRVSPADVDLILFATVLWAFGLVWSRRLLPLARSMASAAEMLVGGAVLLVGSLVNGERLEHWPSTSGQLALVYLIPLDPIIALSAYQYLLYNVWLAVTINHTYVNSVVAVLPGTPFAGERVGGTEELAMLVIISATVLIGLLQWRASRTVA